MDCTGTKKLETTKKYKSIKLAYLYLHDFIYLLFILGLQKNNIKI